MGLLEVIDNELQRLADEVCSTTSQEQYSQIMIQRNCLYCMLEKMNTSYVWVPDGTN